MPSETVSVSMDISYDTDAAGRLLQEDDVYYDEYNYDDDFVAVEDYGGSYYEPSYEPGFCSDTIVSWSMCFLR